MRTQGLGDVEQQSTEAGPLCVGSHVERVEPVALDHHERHHAIGATGNPYLALGQVPAADERPHRNLRACDGRHLGHGGRAHLEIEVGDRGQVLDRGWPQLDVSRHHE